MTEISRFGLIALSILAASGLLADIAIIIILALIKKTGAKLMFGYFDETPFYDQDE